MKKALSYFAGYVFLTVLVTACFNKEPGRSTGGTIDDEIWLIPQTRVVDSGLGFDGIPALELPLLVDATDVDYLKPNDLVIGFFTGDNYRVYPHKILDWHEIINDRDDDLHFTINYCPLTGTGMAWDQFIKGQKTTYGVSGFVYNANLMPYDRRTESLWSQMLVRCIQGEKVGEEPVHYSVIETTWETWQQLYPNSSVLSISTGFERPYDVYPYINQLTLADYRQDEFLISPIGKDDRRLHRKERVLGVNINDEAKVYRFSSFGGPISVISDKFQGEELVIIGSKDLKIILSFFADIDDQTLVFEPIIDDLPNILKDNEGNIWDVFGYATDGPRKGQQLGIPKSNMGYWFAWGAIFEEPEIFE